MASRVLQPLLAHHIEFTDAWQLAVVLKMTGGASIKWSCAGIAVLLFFVAGCADDLGECDLDVAREVVYGRGGVVATKGQALVHDSCGNAAFCHSSNAVGAARHGVPSGLSFDMLPAPTGWPTVTEFSDEMWSQVQDGAMPPTGIAGDTQGDGDWRFDPHRADGSAKLPAISTVAGKAVLRNWLACGAPVVPDTSIPDWALPPDDGGAPMDWSELYTQVIRPGCAIAGCHNAMSAGGLAMLDACSARTQLLQRGACGEPRVVPGDGDSLLLDKIESSDPACGDRMPRVRPLSQSAQAALRAWVEAGAIAEGCE